MTKGLGPKGFGSKGLGSIGDKLSDKKVPCRVRGCSRLWIWRGAEQVKAFSAGQMQPPARMCDLCQARAQTLEDRAVPCATEGCAHTLTWTKLSQLEAIFRHEGQGSPPPPRLMCDDCRGKAAQIGDKQVPCRLRGCSRTWTWTGKAQLQAGGHVSGPAGPGPALEQEPAPPSRMCDECHAAYEALRDHKLACRTKGCSRTWVWTRWAQLEAAAQGGGDRKPPVRMCDECLQALAAFEDQEVPCRTCGCNGSWIWRRHMQLEAQLAGPRPDSSKPPLRMCPSCQSLMARLQDREVPCKRSGCKGTWTWKRGAQLERSLRRPADADVEETPQRLCDACRKGLDKFEDREAPCKNDGCKGTWTWTRFAQLQASEAGHPGKPPAHMCDECRSFMKDRHTKVIGCPCGAELSWTPELQLKTKLGLMVEPTLCGACKTGRNRPGGTVGGVGGRTTG